MSMKDERPRGGGGVRHPAGPSSGPQGEGSAEHLADVFDVSMPDNITVRIEVISPQIPQNYQHVVGVSMGLPRQFGNCK